MIDLTIHPSVRARNIQAARDNGVILPTFREMKHPETIPDPIKNRLRHVGLFEVNPLNLFRVTWKNQPQEMGGLYQDAPNFLELPSSLTGVPCRIVAMAGKWFPTGCHKVGASLGCLLPRLVTGQFDAAGQKAVWPSTGNYCRGGVFNSRLLGVQGVAILPEEMSRERFDWLESIGAEIIATPGCESNVKAIFDAAAALRADPQYMVFNQFEEMGNHLWHYQVTGSALESLFQAIRRPGDRLAGACFTSGSAGTIGCGDYLKEVFPTMKLAVGEALQCPTILNCGFGGHRIEGIGDEHIPWIHNVKNTDMVIAVDDEDALHLLRLFNDPTGLEYLRSALGPDKEFLSRLSWLGISGIANVLCCIKMAKYYEFTDRDVVFTVLTDSADLYRSRIRQLDDQYGPYSAGAAALDHRLRMLGQRTDAMAELGYRDRKRVHNLKYFTWVQQQGRSAQELNDLWYDQEGTWGRVHSQADTLDELICQFNEEAGVLRQL